MEGDLSLGCGPGDEIVVKCWEIVVIGTSWVKSHLEILSKRKLTNIQILVKTFSRRN
jgi:hypothetical protein